MVLLIFALGNFKIGAIKPIFMDSGSPRGGGGVCACVGMVCYYCIHTSEWHTGNSVVGELAKNMSEN